MRKLKKGDPVIVIAWAHKGAISHIVKVDGDKVYLHDVNKVKKAVKWQWFVEKEAPIHISNVAYYEEKTKKPTRVGFKFDEKTGKKVRYSKRTGEVLPELSKKA